MECVGCLFSCLHPDLPSANQGQGPGCPCFPRGAEQMRPFPWGDLEFPLHSCLSMVSQLGKLPNPVVFRAGLTTGQVKSSGSGSRGKNKGTLNN